VEVPSILKAWQKTQAIRQLIQEGKKWKEIEKELGIKFAKPL
jgi:hypothetical protein